MRPTRSWVPERKSLILSCVSALLLVLSFPVFNLKFLAWAAFVPLLVALENKSIYQAFVLAYISGIVFWFGAIYWLVHVTGAGMFVLVLYLALYWGVFGLLICRSGSLRR
jgi:apolipoprotein N-acyltransferase